MRKLYKFYSDWGRQGELEGLFIAEEADVKQAMGKDVYFGEVFGKHSDVEDTLEESMFTEVDVPEEALKVLENELGITWSGFNPIEMWQEQEDERNDL